MHQNIASQPTECVNGRIWHHLSWFILSRGAIGLLTLVAAMPARRTDSPLPSWAIDWSALRPGGRNAGPCNVEYLEESVGDIGSIPAEQLIRREGNALILFGSLFAGVVRTVRCRNELDTRKSPYNLRTSLGLYGFGPEDILPGDRVCLLLGYNYPMIVRGRPSRLELVGHCSRLGCACPSAERIEGGLDFLRGGSAEIMRRSWISRS